MLEFLQQLINGLAQGGIYALIALGYTMVYGILRFVNFAHGDVFMLGAFVGFYAAPWLAGFGLPTSGPLATSLVLACAIFACAAIGILIEYLCYRPLRNQPRITVLITAIGVSLLLSSGGQLVFGAEPKSFPELFTDRALELPAFFGPLRELTLTLSQVIIFAVCLALLGLLHFIVRRTPLGLAMRALSVNPTAAQLMGVNLSVVIAFTFGLGSALAGAGGVLASLQQPSIDPLMGTNAGLKAFVAAVLGGIGSLPGAVTGAFLIGLLEALVVGYISPTYRDPIVFGILIAILVFKPTGLLGAPLREKV
ncbi:branched-chain amino acid ABC transporter permease [Nibricoccus sp. IMCC34717]|uniref:branched-chain amino acid ABC transporter permease n=1 Tax=Nibricoccus sp. IMCC34717 TaxID=3034021 RepID=UPI00385029D7